MAIELHLTRSSEGTTPWGFRLTGGANYEVPLTTIKVVENGIADKSGLTVGDIIVKINEDDITGLTHAQSHDKIIQAGNNLNFTVVRGEMSEQLQAIIQEEESNDEIYNILEGSIPIDYPEKTIEDLIQDEIVKKKLPEHDLNLTDEEIHSIISPQIVTRKEMPTKMPESKERNVKETIEQVKVFQSEVIKEINNNLKELEQPERRWSTFLQRPERPVPDFKPKFEVQTSSYKVVIRTKKDLEAEREAKKAEAEAEAASRQLDEDALLQNGVPIIDEENSSEEGSPDSSDFTFSDSDNCTESTITFTPSGTEPTISFTESLNSLEEKLEYVKEQLQVYHIDLVPDSLQKVLAKIASQLEKIVKVVKPATQQNIPVKNGVDTEDEASYDDFSDDESSSISFDSRISSPTPSTPSYEGTEPTLTFSSSPIMSDPPSVSTPEGTEKSLTFSDDNADVAECDRTEFDVTEMQDYQEGAQIPAGLEINKEGKTTKKEKARDMEEASGPLTPMTRPIILPGGRKWCDPDDAVRTTRRHASLTDEKIDKTISSFYEVVSGKTVGSNIGIIFGPGRLSRNRSTGNQIVAWCPAKSLKQ